MISLAHSDSRNDAGKSFMIVSRSSGMEKTCEQHSTVPSCNRTPATSIRSPVMISATGAPVLTSPPPCSMTGSRFAANAPAPPMGK